MFLAEIDNGTPRLTQNDHLRPPICIPAETTRATSAITENGTEPVFNRRNNSDAVSVVTGAGLVTASMTTGYESIAGTGVFLVS